MLKRSLVVFLLLATCLPVLAKPKKKVYDNAATDLFTAALRTARERHVVTYVDEKMLMFTFETGRALSSARGSSPMLPLSHRMKAAPLS
jgi:hypothetical protein